MAHPYWPLFDLEVRTPRITLRYIDDDLAVELAALAAKGIHDPASTPFGFPWTDVEPPQLERNTMQHYWQVRAEMSPRKWGIELAVIVDGTVIGTGGLQAENYPTLRSVETGSWLGREYQGQGYGKELRTASLHLIFDGFGADFAMTGAWADNAASLGVTRSLGYTVAGHRLAMRRDLRDVIFGFEMARTHWETIRRDDIELLGAERVRQFLEMDSPAATTS